MSNWDSHQPFGHDTFQQPQPRRSSVWMWLALTVGGLFVCCIVCAGVMFWQMVNVLSGNLRSEMASLPGTDEPSLRNKQAEVTAAFNNDSVGVGDVDLRSIQQLMDALVRATQDGDSVAFAQHVDTSRLLQEMQAGGVMKRLGFVEAGIINAQLPQSLSVPAYWTRYRIVHVQRRNPNEAVMYGYFWDTGGESSEVRWWIVRSGQGWKAFDWELLQYGLRGSTELAIYYSYADDPGLDQYNRCMADVRAANQFQADYEYASAAESLRAAESRSVLPQLQDDAALVVGFAWLRSGDAKQALENFRRVTLPAAAPGALYGQALCHSRLSQHQQAIDLAVKYEALVGSGPHVSQLKAEALTSLERTAEAAAEWRKLLKFDPNNFEALRSFGLALAEDEKDVLAEFVSRADDPPATAESLAEGFLPYGDTAAVQAMVTLLRKLAPDSPRVDYVLGLAAESDDDYEQAAELFQKAMNATTDEDQRLNYLYRYLNSTASAGQAVAGYEAAPDPAEAFNYLAGGYEDGESVVDRATLEQLLEAHRKRQPDDPWIHYYAGLLLSEREEYEAAERELRAGIERVGVEESEQEYLLDGLRYQMVSVLSAQGRHMEAYETIEPPEETFRQIADICRWAGKTEELKQLVAAHRAAQPDDLWLDLYDGLVHAREQNYAEADRLLARGYKAATEEYLKSQYRDERLNARIAAGNALSAYEDLEPAEEVFTALASRFSSDGQWSQLETLLGLHRTQHADDPQLLRWEAEMHWQRKDYERLIDLLDPWPEVLAHDPSSWQFSQLKDQLLKSYLRLDRLDEALEFFQSMYEESGESRALIIVHAAEKNLEETSRWMGEAKQRTYSLSSLYDDEDVGRIMRSKEFAPLREKYPPSLPLNEGAADIVLLLKQPIQLEAAQLRVTITGLSHGEVTMTEAPGFVGTKDIHGLVARSASGAVCVSAGDHRYTDDEPASDIQIQNQTLRQAIDEHTAWVAVQAIQFSGESDDATNARAHQIAAALLDENCLAVYLAEPSRILENSAATQAFLSAEQRAPNQPTPAGESNWLYYFGELETESTATWLDSRRRFKALTAAFEERREGQRVFVKVALEVGVVAEPHWLEVKRIVRRDYNQKSIVCDFTTDSSLIPYLTAGEPVSVEQYQIVDWKSTESASP